MKSFVYVSNNILSPMTGMSLWYKPEGITPQSDGTGLASWPQSVANLNQATQDFSNVTGATQPLYKTSGQNGKPFVRFDGVSSFLRPSSMGDWAADAPLSGPMTWFVVMKGVKPASGAYLWNSGTASTPQAIWIYLDPTGFRAGADVGGSITNGSYTAGTHYVFTAIIQNGASSLIRVNGGSQVTGTIPVAGGGPNTTVGRYAAGSSNFLAMDLYEILVYPTALSAPSMATTEAYLTQKYAL